MSETVYSRDDLIDLANGAAFMGSGGGGPLSAGLALAKSLPADVKIPLVAVDNVPDTGLSVVVADMGAPDSMTTPSAQPMIEACGAYAKQVGKDVSALVAVEIGGLNSVVPFMVARAMGRPVVDGDGAGRAVPSLTQLTFSGYDVPSAPAVLSDGQGQDISISAKDAAAVEELARPVLAADFGQAAGLAMWGMDKALLAKAMPIRGSLELARQVGVALRSGCDPVDGALDLLTRNGRPAEVIAQGILQTPEETTSGGFDFGRITLLDKKNDRRIVIYNQNENLMAWASDQSSPIVTAPDSICYVTPGGRTFSNADIDDSLIGEEVLLIRIRACKVLWTLESVCAAFSSALEALGYPGPLLDRPIGALAPQPVPAE